jgi:hypothetical protein
VAWFKIDATHNAAPRLWKNDGFRSAQAVQTRMPVLADDHVIVHRDPDSSGDVFV